MEVAELLILPVSHTPIEVVWNFLNLPARRTPLELVELLELLKLPARHTPVELLETALSTW